jgi:urate oxidase
LPTAPSAAWAKPPYRCRPYRCKGIDIVKLAAHRYGKSRVRIMKILRDGPVHTVRELTASVLLEGAFDRGYTHADNRSVVATDTMKNTIHVLAHELLGTENEPFARQLAEHFLNRYSQLSQVTVEIDERRWTRVELRNGRHPHCFVQSEVARPFTRLMASRGQLMHESGIRDLMLLKSTGSGFEGFLRDDLTTLPDTRDRILATSLRASWLWARTPVSYTESTQAILEALVLPFADGYSPSVQATLYAMAEAALHACHDIEKITMTMPNLHCLAVDLTPFGRENRQQLFVPTDEPHGVIEATVTR